MLTVSTEGEVTVQKKNHLAKEYSLAIHFSSVMFAYFSTDITNLTNCFFCLFYCYLSQVGYVFINISLLACMLAGLCNNYSTDFRKI